MSLINTPRSNRLHIGIYGRRNSGKSSLINALTGQDAALVSDIAGTTTDPVYKTMEINGIGPCVFIDTAGFDDEGTLGDLRIEQTKKALQKTDVALMVVCQENLDKEIQWMEMLKKAKIPVITVLNKTDIQSDTKALAATVSRQLGSEPLLASATEKTGLKEIIAALIRHIPEDYDTVDITNNLVSPGDTVLLVMPQDIQAPKGRLILPQVQTIRELLDKQCIVISTITTRMEETLKKLVEPPALIITDSQVFKTVYDLKPATSKLTSFSVLFASYKGDIDYFVQSAAAIDRLNNHSRVLIAEACTHAPLSEDIGREQIPRLLRKRFGAEMTIDLTAGNSFPQDLSSYDLIIHCGACMFNRKYVLSRIAQAREQGVPMTNYGITIAHLNGILDKISF